MSAVETLRKARELLTPEGAWGRGKMGADRFGAPADLYGPNTVCWCVLGALYRAEGKDERQDEARPWLLKVLGGAQSLALWNDAPERTHAEVLAAFDRAIALAGAGEGGPQ